MNKPDDTKLQNSFMDEDDEDRYQRFCNMTEQNRIYYCQVIAFVANQIYARAQAKAKRV